MIKQTGFLWHRYSWKLPRHLGVKCLSLACSQRCPANPDQDSLLTELHSQDRGGRFAFGLGAAFMRATQGSPTVYQLSHSAAFSMYLAC